ncbi:MAG: divalent metal cation transporter, partial [Bacteroidales bacterium]|nr:divalent metal cation transporter [Bacteroidales bacterium]
IKRQLKYEYIETLFSMGIGWASNSAMIILAAAVFFKNNVVVTELQQAKDMLVPLLSESASNIFAIALLFASISSTITSGIAGGSIFAGMFMEEYNIKDPHSKLGVLISFGIALIILFFVKDPFMGLIYSQTLLSIQLPITIILLIYLTSSKKIMGKYANNIRQKIVLWTIAVVLIILNLILVTGIA